MGDENKPVASFLSRKGGPPPAPVPPSELPPPSQPGNSGALPPPPMSVGGAKLSGKFKAPGNKSILGTVPKMSAIAIRGAMSGMMPATGNQAAAARARTGVFQKLPAAPAPEPELLQAPPVPQIAEEPGDRSFAEQFLQRGLDHFDRGEFDQALDAYNEAIRVDPSFAMAYNNLGMVLIDLERYEEAMSALYGSIGRDENYSEAYNNLGFVLRRLGNDLEAIAAYQRFLSLEPDVEEGSKIRGWIETVMAEHGLSEVPELTLPSAHALPPTAALDVEPPKIKKMAAWEAAAGDVATAASLNALGEFGDSEPTPAVRANLPAKPALQPIPPKKPFVAAVSESVEEQENRLVALIEKSLDEFEAGNIDQARELAEQAVSVNNQSSEAHTALGKILVREEKLDEGIQHLETAIELDPHDPAPYYVLGFTLRALERNVEAAEIYEKFLTLMPDAADAAKMRQWIMQINGIGLADAGDTEDDGYVDVDPIVTEVDQRYKAVHDYFRSSTADATIQGCQEILAEQPEHVRTRVLLGRAYLCKQDFDNAASEFAQALEYDPGNSETLYFMGQCEEKRGDSPRALKLYRSYVENHPDGPRVDKLRAWFLSHGVSETGKGLSQQIQCEWCLRFFDDQEISLHENKATCNGCLTLMGSTPIQDANKLEIVDPVEDKRGRKAARSVGGGKIIKRLVLVAAAGSVAALVALVYLTTMLDPLLAKMNIKIPGKNTGGPILTANLPADTGGQKVAVIPPPDTDIEPGDVVPDKIKVIIKPMKLNLNFDGTKVKIKNAPERDFAVFSRWSWKPELEGVEVLDADAPGWEKEISFPKERPIGMRVEKGVIVWDTAEAKDFEALKRGSKVTVEVMIKGFHSGPDGVRKDFFQTTRTFTVASQFGYELGQELDVGLPTDARNVELTSLGGEAGLRSLGVLHGSQTQGGARSVSFGLDGVKNSVSLAEGARFSAACEFSISEPALNGILTANWKTGEIQMRVIKGGNFETISTVKFAPGTMALAAMETEKGTLAVAALSSATGTLSISTYTATGGFSAPRNVHLTGGGGNSRLIAWKSAKQGPGFLAVMPLAEDPLRFVALKGASDKENMEPVRSTLKAEGVITAAVPMENPEGSRRIALVLGGKTSYLILMEEKNGAFTQVGSTTTLPGPGLGAVAWDFNKDGMDDLFVTMRDEASFYFAGPNDALTQGPALSNPGMMGTVAILNIRNNSRPLIAVMNENRKARIFKPVGEEPATQKTAASAISERALTAK